MQSHLLEQTQELVFGISISSPSKGLQGKVSEQMLHKPGSENQELKILWLSCWSWSWPPMSNITARPYLDHRPAQSSRSCWFHPTPRSPTPFMAESNTTPVRGKQGGLVSGWSISRQNNSIVDREHEGKDYVDEAIKVSTIIVLGVHQPPREKDPRPGVWYWSLLLHWTYKLVRNGGFFIDCIAIRVEPTTSSRLNVLLVPSCC